jgi:hypothetical protein
MNPNRQESKNWATNKTGVDPVTGFVSYHPE